MDCAAKSGCPPKDFGGIAENKKATPPIRIGNLEDRFCVIPAGQSNSTLVLLAGAHCYLGLIEPNR
jgi:hypothetical protein